VDLNHYYPGRLLTISASLFFSFWNGISKLRFLVSAPSEKFAFAVVRVRPVLAPAPHLISRR
jgi:hypothetical protein